MIGPRKLPVLWFKARRVGPARRGCSWLDGLGCRSLSAKNVVWSPGKLLRLRADDKNVAVREGSAREFENSLRKCSAHSFPVLNGSVLTGQMLRYDPFLSLSAKDLKGGGVRDVSSCFYNSCERHSCENRRIYFCSHVFNANHWHIALFWVFCPACKEISVEFLMVNFKGLWRDMNAGVFCFCFNSFLSHTNSKCT